jgi:hypothetical protein
MKPETERNYSGYYISAEFQAIALTVRFGGGLSINVYKTAAGMGPGADCGSIMTHDLPTYFAPEEIAVTEGRMTCLARPPFAEPNSAGDFFRAGFAVDLAPGMSAAITAALEKLVPLSALMADVYAKTDTLLATQGKRVDHFNYLHGAAEDLLAQVHLDGRPFEHAIDAAFSLYGDGSKPDVALFKQALLAADSANRSAP